MKVIVKNVAQQEEIFEVNLEDTVSVLASLVKERFNYEYNAKLIYIGKVLLHDMLMKNYFNEHLKTILICLEDKSKEKNEKNEKVEVVEEEVEEVEEEVEKVEELEEVKEQKIENTRAIIYAFFTLVSNDTALNYLFFNNPKTIYSLIKNGHLDDLIKQFMEQSDKISEILESGLNKSIDIELSANLKLNVLSAILSESTLLEGFIKK